MPGHTLVACAIFRDEAPFLAEWLEFHRLVGVDHVHLYDNGSADRPERVLEPFLDDGFVTLHSWPIPFRLQAARRAYADCLERVRGRARWLTCIDLDEFLFSPRSATLPPVLREYEEFPGVVVRWQVYGSAGHRQASPEPVLARFDRRAPSDWIRNRRVKSIVDPERAVEPLNCHHFAFRGGARAVDERRVPVDLIPRPRFRKRLRPLFGLLGPALRYLDPWAGTDVSERAIHVDHLRINHYPIKSLEEFQRKARLKEGKKRYDGIDYFAYHDRNEIVDPILHRYLPELRARLGAEGMAAGEGGR